MTHSSAVAVVTDIRGDEGDKPQLAADRSPSPNSSPANVQAGQPWETHITLQIPSCLICKVEKGRRSPKVLPDLHVTLILPHSFHTDAKSKLEGILDQLVPASSSETPFYTWRS